jgi:hypothetical protein
MCCQQVIRNGAFRLDEGLKHEIADVVAPSFIDEVNRLGGAINRCDTLYLLRDGRGALMCLLMVAWENLEVDEHRVPTLYTGLFASRPDQKNTGRVLRLVDSCLSDAQRWEQQNQQKLTIWGTTATPSAYFVARKLFANTQPCEDGTYSEEAATIARAIGRQVGVSIPAGGHPFVFPRLAAGVHYTEVERRRIAAVCKAKQFTLFDRLGIDENRGDRLLFIGEVPAVLRRPAALPD